MFTRSSRWCGNKRLGHILFGCGIFFGGRNDGLSMCFPCLSVVSAGAKNRGCGIFYSAAGSFLGAAMTAINRNIGLLDHS